MTRSKLTAAMHSPCIKPTERSVAQVVKEMDRYRMDIIKITEARWMGSRMMKERSGYTVTRGEPTHRRRVDRNVNRSEIIDGMEATLAKTHHG